MAGKKYYAMTLRGLDKPLYPFEIRNARQMSMLDAVVRAGTEFAKLYLNQKIEMYNIVITKEEYNNLKQKPISKNKLRKMLKESKLKGLVMTN